MSTDPFRSKVESFTMVQDMSSSPKKKIIKKKYGAQPDVQLLTTIKAEVSCDHNNVGFYFRSFTLSSPFMLPSISEITYTLKCKSHDTRKKQQVGVMTCSWIIRRWHTSDVADHSVSIYKKAMQMSRWNLASHEIALYISYLVFFFHICMT